MQPSRLTAVVDIGSNPIDGAPPYADMLASNLCTVVGFEPQQQALEILNRRKGRLETYLPYAIGDGSEQVLHVTAAAGMTSLLQPNPATLALFTDFATFGKVLRTEPVQTRRLDDVPEAGPLDFLKLDIQGGELAAIRSGAGLLQNAVAVMCEVSFMPIYRDQPSFGDIDIVLRDMGFIPHCLVETKVWPLAPFRQNKARQLMEADMLYVRNYLDVANMSGEQWKHLALIAHHCFRSTDLALHAVKSAATAGAAPKDSPTRYIESLQPAKKLKRK